MRAVSNVACAVLALSPALAPAAVGHKAEKAMRYCVPLRDGRGQLTGSDVCRTEAQWRRYVAMQAAQPASADDVLLPRRTATFYTLQGWNHK